jgi:hypothetical protein
MPCKIGIYDSSFCNLTSLLKVYAIQPTPLIEVTAWFQGRLSAEVGECLTTSKSVNFVRGEWGDLSDKPLIPKALANAHVHTSWKICTDSLVSASLWVPNTPSKPNGR